jgi:hypothetical protein
LALPDAAANNRLLFGHPNRQLRGRCFASGADRKGYVEDTSSTIRHVFEEWRKRQTRCIKLEGEYLGQTEPFCFGILAVSQPPALFPGDHRTRCMKTTNPRNESAANMGINKWASFGPLAHPRKRPRDWSAQTSQTFRAPVISLRISVLDYQIIRRRRLVRPPEPAADQTKSSRPGKMEGSVHLFRDLRGTAGWFPGWMSHLPEVRRKEGHNCPYPSSEHSVNNPLRSVPRENASGCSVGKNSSGNRYDSADSQKFAKR